MKNKLIVVGISLLLILINTLLYFPIVSGFLMHVYDTPDRKPPIGLTSQQFGQTSSALGIIALLLSSILLIYILFKEG